MDDGAGGMPVAVEARRPERGTNLMELARVEVTWALRVLRIKA